MLTGNKRAKITVEYNLFVYEVVDVNEVVVAGNRCQLHVGDVRDGDYLLELSPLDLRLDHLVGNVPNVNYALPVERYPPVDGLDELDSLLLVRGLQGGDKRLFVGEIVDGVPEAC
jgi:hypothetical protein